MMTNIATIHVLLVEHEPKLAHSMEKTLMKCGYEVELVQDPQRAIEHGVLIGIKMIIVDVNVLNDESFGLLHTLRLNSPNIPILILSGHDSAGKRIKALEEGADDFLTKPFDAHELCARVQAVLWRVGISRNSLLQAGDLTMDLVRRIVKRGTKTIRLTRTEFSLLELLLKNKNSVLSRDSIREQVWGEKFKNGTNIVDVYINYLRTSVDREQPSKLIWTVRGKGFVLKEE
jgi:two-component system copper resistance phosphate regulon response regulator CusR